MGNVRSKRRESAAPQVSAEKAGLGTLNLIRLGAVFVLLLISYGAWTQTKDSEPMVIALWFVLLLGAFLGRGLQAPRK